MADAHAHDDHGHDDHDDHGHDDHAPDPYIVYPTAETAGTGFSTAIAAIAFIVMVAVVIGLVKGFA